MDVVSTILTAENRMSIMQKLLFREFLPILGPLTIPRWSLKDVIEAFQKIYFTRLKPVNKVAAKFRRLCVSSLGQIFEG